MANVFVVFAASLLLHVLLPSTGPAVSAEDGDHQFRDEANQCELKIKDDVLRQLSDTMQTQLVCDTLWTNLLQQFHYSRGNLTECRAREEQVATADAPSSSFCQLLLDDAQRQMEQERRKHGAEMDQKLQEIQRDARQHRMEADALQRNLTDMRGYRKTLYLELVLTNIGVGDTDQALQYYQRYSDGKQAAQLSRTIVQSVYREAKHQNQRLENLLDFVRRLSDSRAKLNMYQLIKAEVMKRQKQRDHYVAAMVALDFNAALQNELDNSKRQNEHLYKDLLEPVVKRWQDEIAAGNYTELAEFATNQPKYFEQLQSRLATVDSGSWLRVSFDRLVAYPNSLPRVQQRLEALSTILGQVYERNRNNSHDYLVKTAGQLHICEKFMGTQSNDPSNANKLKQLQGRFVQFASKNYEYYLRESLKSN